ncbi:MAG: dipeptidyl-peptidase 3 family protein [Alphaproteobacteria bacterium]
MKQIRWLGAASAIALALAACGAATTTNNSATANGAAETAEANGLAKLAEVRMDVDTSYLTAEEREVVNLLIQAANQMSEIYKRQTTPDYDRLRAEVEAKNDPELLKKFDVFFGPWDELEDDKPFFGGKPKPPGAGFYPADLTKEEFDKYLAAHSDEAEALTSPYTVVKRQGDKLVAVPYSQEYKQWLEPAARLLEQAAAKTSNPSLKKFLTLRAKAFRTDDYFESELAWMDLKDTPIEIAIGPYETYTDGLYGRKTAFEAFVTLRNPEESAKLDKYKALLRDMEANLPVEDKYKNFQRGFESPISVVDQVHGGGDNVPGVQTIAFNLPNDERVREAKGAKKVILQNVLGAKYERILKPMAALVLVPDQAGDVTKAYMFNETLFHELSHSLGPGSIVVGGRKTTVDKGLKELGSGFEEAKADVMGAWNILFMMDRGILPKALRNQIRATYVAGLFRAMRFGIGEAHGQGAAMQYRYLRSKGALVWDEGAQRFRVVPDKIDGAIRDLVADIVRLQANGDYQGVKAFLGKWAKLDPEAEKVIASMSHIPVDIRPIYPERV